MNEIPMFFGARGQRLFGVLHQAAPMAEPGCGWVFCHPFAEEKLWAHRVFVGMARHLAAQGMPVLRFDYRGYGDSDGAFEQFTMADHIADVRTAVDKLQETAPEISGVGLLGLRYGATLALLAATENPDIERLVLWDPVVDMAQYLQDQLRTNLTTQMVLHGKVIENRDQLVARIRANQPVNVDGYDLTNPFFDQACAVRPLEAAVRVSVPVQIIEIARASQAARADLRALADALPEARLQRVEELQFWKELKQFVRHSPALAEALDAWMEAACA